MKKSPKYIYCCLLFSSIVFFSYGASCSELLIKNQNDAVSLFANASKIKSSNPWHFTNLYEKASNSFFIPYHLWSGATWNGQKSVEECLHKVENTWVFNRRGKERKQKILAPVFFHKKGRVEALRTFKSANRKNYQHYICHKMGLARVYDERFERSGDLHLLDGKECKFPAGFGWRIGEVVDCSKNSPKATKIVELVFDKDFLLKKMKYTFEEKKGSRALRKDDYYEYVPNKGRVLHKKLN